MSFTTNYLHIDGSLMIDGSIFLGEQPLVNGIDKASQSYVNESLFIRDTSIRHLQSILSSGLIYGGLLSINSDTSKYDVSAGCGFIINNTNPIHPIIKDVSWNDFIGNLPSNLTTELVTYVSINSDGSIYETNSPLDSSGRRNYIYLGTVVHSNKSFINAINNQPTVGIDVAAQLQDLMQSFGFRSISGNRIGPKDADLKIRKDVGVAFKPGANFQILNSQPHIFTLPEQSTVTFRYRNQDSSEGSDITDIDPTTWDASGVTTTITNSAYSTIQRVYIFPSSFIRIQRGQKVYTTLSNAFEAISSESFIVEKNISDNALFLGSIILSKNCTDLSATDRALFIPAAGISSMGSVSLFPTLQQSYDISNFPQIIGRLDLNGSLNIYDKLDVSGNLHVSGSTIIDGSLYISSISNLNSLLTPNSSTSLDISFDKIQGYIYGTISSPITNDISINLINAIIGVTDLVISKKTAEPVYPTTFKKLSGIYDTSTGVNNFIYIQYLDSSNQLYTINQII